MESKLLGNRDPGWEKPQALLSLPTFGETKAVLLAGSFRVPSTAQNIYFLFSSFFFFAQLSQIMRKKPHKTI